MNWNISLPASMFPIAIPEAKDHQLSEAAQAGDSMKNQSDEYLPQRRILHAPYMSPIAETE